ncbi:G-protein coupled receptor 12 [Pogona vitticeps]
MRLRACVASLSQLPASASARSGLKKRRRQRSVWEREGLRERACLLFWSRAPLIHWRGAGGPECERGLLTSEWRFVSRAEPSRGEARGAGRQRCARLGSHAERAGRLERQGLRKDSARRRRRGRRRKAGTPAKAMLPNPAAAAAALDEQLQEQQRRLLMLLQASARPFAPLWPPSNASAVDGSPADLSPAAAAAAAAAAAGRASGEEPGGGGGGGSGAGDSGGGGPGPSGEPGGGGGTSSGGPGGGLAGAAGLNPWDVALCATGAATAGENALVLAVLLYAPSLRAPSLLLIGSLALADLLAGLGLVVNFGVQYLLPPPSEAATLGAAGLLLTAFSASACSLLAITADRYLSLSNALTYHSARALPATAAALLLAWLLCLGAGMLPWLGWNCLRQPGACSVARPVTRPQAAALAVAFLLLFALVLLLDAQICRIAVRHAQQIAVQRQFVAAAAQATSTRKGLATLSLTVGLFAVCWMPFALYALVADASYPPVYAHALALPAAAHSLLNPFVYAFRNPDIQKALWLACCGCIPAGFASRPRTSSDV